MASLGQAVVVDVVGCSSLRQMRGCQKKRHVFTKPEPSADRGLRTTIPNVGAGNHNPFPLAFLPSLWKLRKLLVDSPHWCAHIPWLVQFVVSRWKLITHQTHHEWQEDVKSFNVCAMVQV